MGAAAAVGDFVNEAARNGAGTGGAQPGVASSYASPTAAKVKKRPTFLGAAAQNRPGAQGLPDEPPATELGGAAGSASVDAPVQRMGNTFGRPARQKQLLGYAGTFLTGPRGTALGG